MAGFRPQPSDKVAVTRDLQRLRQQLIELEAAMAELQADIAALDGNVAPGAHASTHLPGGTDALTTAAPGTIQPDDAAAVGTAASFARSDHKHAIAAAAPGSIEPDDAAAEGVSTSFARADHKHSIVAATAGAATPGDAAAEGTATSFARSDHKHSLPAFGTTSGTFCQGNDSRIGGVGGVNVWFPDAPPTSPHSKDDEFTGNSLDAKWGTWDPGTTGMSATVDTTKRMLKMTVTGNGSIRWSGIYQAVPGGGVAYQAMAKVFLRYPISSAGATIGVFVSEDIVTNPTTADFRMVERICATTNPIARTRTWASYNAAAGTSITSLNFDAPYIRLRSNGGTTCASDVSLDGVSWYQVASVTLGFTPSYFGLCVHSGDNTVVATAYVDYFRVLSGVGSDALDTDSGRFV